MRLNNFFYLGIFFFCFFIFSACTIRRSILEGDELRSSEITYLKSLGILHESEKIILFDSQLDTKTSGSFFTDQGAGSYWKNNKNPEDNRVDYVKYSDIENIMISYSDEWDTATSIKIDRADGSSFNLYIDDEKENEEGFFDQLNKRWQSVVLRE